MGIECRRKVRHRDRLSRVSAHNLQFGIRLRRTTACTANKIPELPVRAVEGIRTLDP
jgi:hypothetical protein